MTATLTAGHVMEPAAEHLVQDLAARVEQILWQDDRLRSTDSLVDVTVTPEGAVTLAGHVRGDMLKYLAGRLVVPVPGVSAVNNLLVADTDLENEIAVALAMDPAVETYTDQLIVKVMLGVVHLTGTISAADMTTAESARIQAERLARATPGVRDVINNARAVVGSASESAAAPEATPATSGDEQQVAMQARLLVWKERAQAKQ